MRVQNPRLHSWNRFQFCKNSRSILGSQQWQNRVSCIINSRCPALQSTRLSPSQLRCRLPCSPPDGLPHHSATIHASHSSPSPGSSARPGHHPPRPTWPPPGHPARMASVNRPRPAHNDCRAGLDKIDPFRRERVPWAVFREAGSGWFWTALKGFIAGVK